MPDLPSAERAPRAHPHWRSIWRWSTITTIVGLLVGGLTLALGSFDLRERLTPQGLTIEQWGSAAQAVCLNNYGELRTQQRQVDDATQAVIAMLDLSLEDLSRFDQAPIEHLAREVEDDSDLRRKQLAALRNISTPASPEDKATVRALLSDGEKIIAAKDAVSVGLETIPSIDLDNLQETSDNLGRSLAVLNSVSDLLQTTDNVYVSRWTKTVRRIGAPSCAGNSSF